MNLQDCLDKKYLVKSEPDKELSEKELNEARYDLDKAIKAFEDKDYKWCIVKSYYVMFHAAKSILFKLGYTEKKHIAILIVLEDLNRKGKIENRFIIDYKAAMSAREDADYHYSYSMGTAEHDLKICKEFLDMAEKLLKKI